MQFPTPRATIALVAVTSVAWLIASSGSFGDIVAVLAGFIPARATQSLDVPGAVPFVLTPLTSTLIHAGFAHLAFNMLMLLICGRMVEAALGRWGLVLLYVLGAYGAAAAQYAMDPASIAPVVGASGAISALVGAYALLFGQRSSKTSGRSGELLHILWLAAAWVGIQILVNFAIAGNGPMIATAAHVGGFIIGLVLARPLLRFRYRNA